MPGRRERFHSGFSRVSAVGFRRPALVFRRGAGPLPSLSPQAVRGQLSTVAGSGEGRRYGGGGDRAGVRLWCFPSGVAR